jgi:hypothetical protein
MRLLLAALAFTTIASQAARAQGILRLPASARALGMGNIGVVGRDDDVVFYNPAQLAVARGTTLSGERDSESPGSGPPNFVTGAVSSAIAFGTGGVGIGGMFARTVTYPNPTFLNSVISVAATAAAAQVIKSIRVGIAGKYLGEQADRTYESRTMFDLGLARPFRQYFTAGLAVQNVQIAGDDLTSAAPTKATLGASAIGPVGPYDMMLIAAVSMDDHDHRARAAAGAEINWSWLNGYNVAFRAGVRDPLAGEKPYTVGLGLSVDRLSLDYALETLGVSGISHSGHRIGLRVR